jgi:D-alanyl-D-alanine carboxypeptidase
MLGRLSLAGSRFPYVVFVGAALMVFLAATACSGSESTTSEETTSYQATSSEVTTAEGSAAEVEAAVESAMEKNDLKAVLVRVTQNGEEVATVVRGESMTGVPATEDMHFRNGSVVFSYLATVLLQLVDEDVVELDDTIDTWLPDLPSSDRITLRMLANSTSGYIDYVPLDSFEDAIKKEPFAAWTDDELIKMVTDQPLLYEPGTNWSYSHGNWVILAKALTAITGKPVDQLIRERITEPLGLKGTQSYDTAEIPEPVLHAYSSFRGTYEESTFWDPSWSTAKGAVMITDIDDLVTSARAMGTGELVSAESYEEQLAPTTVGLGVAPDNCPKSACSVFVKQQPTAYFGLGNVVLGGWVLQDPQFSGYGAVQAYLPSEDLAIAAAATHNEDVEEGLNGGKEVFDEIASVLAPDHPPKP